MDIWIVGAPNQLFIRGSYTEANFFSKNKVVISKTPLFVIGPFWTLHSIFLLLTSDLAVLYGTDCVFKLFVLSTKELSSRFLKKALVFQKICFKVLKTFKISSDCHMKTCRSLKRRAILKIPCTVEPIRRTYAFLLALKVKFLFQ